MCWFHPQRISLPSHTHTPSKGKRNSSLHKVYEDILLYNLDNSQHRTPSYLRDLDFCNFSDCYSN